MFFKKQQKKPSSQTARHSLLSRTVTGILWVQRRWAAYMGRISRHWTRRGKILFLVSVCAFFGGSSLWVLLPVFTGEHKETLARPDPLPPTIHPGLRESHPSSRLDSRDTALFRQFRQKIDSLQTTPEGRAALRQFMEQRPGFIDSLHHIERLLHLPDHEQKK